MTASSATAVSYDPRTGLSTPAPPTSSAKEVDVAVHRAAGAARILAGAAPSDRAAWLVAVADAIDKAGPRLAALADEETALGVTRLTGETRRAADAIRFYADVARNGSWLGATIDHGDDTRPDLRRLHLPLGPVAVFGASNFPFSYGVFGHDTASALAVGCPVVVKAHPAHPRLSAALATVVRTALASSGAPEGCFQLVAGFDAGSQLVSHPLIQAVGFTGSQGAGVALWRQAASRETPIPVFAEMGTINTAVVTRAALARADEIAAGFVASFTLGMGQFCTKPGLLLCPAGSDLATGVGDALAQAHPQGWLLTEPIARSFRARVDELILAGAELVARIDGPADGWSAPATILSARASALTAGSVLLEECFGPVAIVAEYADDAELNAIIGELPGSLATAVHGARDHDPQLSGLVTQLSMRCGRVVVNGWPTGATMSWAQQHGGPWPATSNPGTTSVGAAALLRFLRPVALQDVPSSALPAAVRDDNPWDIPQRVIG